MEIKMNGNNNIRTMVIIFTALILGAVFLGVLSDYRYASETLSNVTNETLTVSSLSGTVANGGVTNLVAIHNVSGATTYTNGITNGSITFDYDGSIISTEPFPSGTYNVSYYYGDTSSYWHNSRARTIFPIILVFFAIGILLYGIYWAYDSLKEHL